MLCLSLAYTGTATFDLNPEILKGLLLLFYLCVCEILSLLVASKNDTFSKLRENITHGFELLVEMLKIGRILN